MAPAPSCPAISLSISATMAVLLLAAPAEAGSSGAVGAETTTKVGCTEPAPYDAFETTYAAEGRAAAYKMLAGRETCMILERPTRVRLQEAVGAFDFDWGTGQIWRVTPVSKDSEAPETLFIRIRERDWEGG